MDEEREKATQSQDPESRDERTEPTNMEESLAWGLGGDAHPGDILEGKVVHISNDGVLVDVGAKSEGIIHLRDLTHRKVDRPEDVVTLGEVISVYVIGFEGEEGVLKLSKRRAQEQLAWDKLEEAMKSGEVLEAPVVEVVKGGLVADVGLRGFIPASLIAPGFVSDLESFLNQTVRVRVVEIDRSKRRAILSRKQVLEEASKQQHEEIWSKIAEGQIWEGTVKSLTDFGAFIDLGGVDGLLHISEMSWNRIKHPREILEVGQKIRVKVLRLNPEKGKISLGLRQVEGNPWDDAVDKYVEGNLYRGTVVRLAAFGVFVELEPGIDGLVHISQLADYRVNDPAELVATGDEIAVKVLQVEPDRKRISLSKREADAEGGLDALLPPEPEDEDQTPGRMTAYHAGDWDDEEIGEPE